MRRFVLISMVIAGLMPLNAVGSNRVNHARLEPGLLAATEPAVVIARFTGRAPSVAIPGLSVRHRYRSISAFSALATPEAIRALAARDDLAYLERDKPVVFALDTATQASRAKHVFDGAFAASKGEAPVLDAGGAPVDGRGVGIAIVDSGLDGTHPDFEPAGKIGGNYVVTPNAVVAAPYTNLAAAHGTHVAGIAAGTGLLSGGANRGAAPGATLYGFGIGAGGTIEFASAAFDWILANGARQDPPIRVVNNSWGCGGAACERFNPYGVHNYLATKMAEAGIVLSWAAGNDGGDGWVSSVNAEITNPAPGIIGVANYNDQDSTKRDLCIASSSSRGASDDPTTWPDLAAPGTKIMSTYAIGPDQETRQPVTNTNAYRELSGTSMAAPHIAGIVALMLQANPSLRPAEVEYILKSTASKLTVTKPCWSSSGRPRTSILRADPAHTYDGSNFESGHGLVDAYAAVRAAQDFGGIPPAPAAEPIPDSFRVSRKSVDVDETLYMRPDGSLSAGFPADATTSQPIPLAAGVPVPFETAPFPAAKQISGITVEPWLGTTGEFCETSLNPFQVRADVLRVPPAGAPQVIAKAHYGLRFVCAAAPFERWFIFPLTDAVTFDAGDRLRVLVSFEQTGALTAGAEPSTEGQALLWVDGALTASRVGLGSAVRFPAASSAEECLVRQDCADLGPTAPNAGILCGPSLYALTWFGAPGTGIGVECGGSLAAACVVPGLPTDPAADCVAESVHRSEFSHGYGYCFAILPPGATGSGRCRSVKLIEDDRQEAIA